MKTLEAARCIYLCPSANRCRTKECGPSAVALYLSTTNRIVVSTGFLGHISSSTNPLDISTVMHAYAMDALEPSNM